MQKLVVESKDSGKKLITFITSKYSNLKIGDLRRALKQKDIKINGKRVNKDVILNKGDNLYIYIADNVLEGIKENEKTDITFEDENILIVDKPQDTVVTGTNSLTEALQKKYDYIAPCHRIDRNTVGLVMFAKNEGALKYIKDKFRNGEIEKHYIANCYGIPKQNEAELEAYLFKDRKKAIVYISDVPKTGYVKIKTSYKVVSANKESNTSVLDVTLHTGRTHQIRAHLAHMGLPIIGDGKYRLI